MFGKIANWCPLRSEQNVSPNVSGEAQKECHAKNAISGGPPHPVTNFSLLEVCINLECPRQGVFQ